MASVKCSVPGCTKWSFQGRLCKQHYVPGSAAPARVAPAEVVASTTAGTKETIVRPGYRMSFIKSQFVQAAAANRPPPPPMPGASKMPPIIEAQKPPPSPLRPVPKPPAVTNFQPAPVSTNLAALKNNFEPSSAPKPAPLRTPPSPLPQNGSPVAAVNGVPASIAEFVEPTTPTAPTAACSKCWNNALVDTTTFTFTVPFAPKTAVLDTAAKRTLDSFAGWLKTFSTIKIDIKGYTAGAPEKEIAAEVRLRDASGRFHDDKNMTDLARWRAEAVWQKLCAAGLPAPFMTHSAAGSSEKGARVEVACVLTTRTKQHNDSKGCDRCKCDCHVHMLQSLVQPEAKHEIARPEPITVPQQTLVVSDPTPRAAEVEELSVHVGAPAVAGETGTPLPLAGRVCRRATPEEVTTRTRVEKMLATRYVSAPPRTAAAPSSCCQCQEEPAILLDQSSPDYEVKDGKLMVSAIAYEPNSAVLQANSIPIVTAVATLLKRNPKVHVHLVGYTAGPAGRDDLALVRDLVDAQDEEVEEACFLELSQWRAEAVCDKLISLGVDPDRLTFSGAGTDGNGARTEFICVNQYRRKGDWLKGCSCQCHIPKTGKCCSCQEPIASAPIISDEETPLYSVRGGKIYMKRGLLFEPMSAILDVSSKQDIALLAALFVRFPEAVLDVVNYTHTPGIYNDVQLPHMIVDHHAFVSACATMLDLSRWRAESVVRMLVAAGVSHSQFQNIAGKGTDGNGMRTEFMLLNSWQQDRVVGERIDACSCNCHPGTNSPQAANGVHSPAPSPTSAPSPTGAPSPPASGENKNSAHEEQPVGETDEALVLVGRPRMHASIAEIIERSKTEPKPSVGTSEAIPARLPGSNAQCCACCDDSATIPDDSNDDLEVVNGVIIAKKGIIFKPNSALLVPKSFPVVRVVADLLKKHPNVKIHVTGYAGGSANRDDLVKVRGLVNKEGEVEESASFLELSRWRAEMFQSKLVICGVDSSQVTCSGAGTDGKGARVELMIMGHMSRSKGDCLEGCICSCHIPRTGKCCRCHEAIPPPSVLPDEETPVYAVRNGKFYLKKNILFEPMSGMMDVASKHDVATIGALFARFPQAIIHITNYTDLPNIQNEEELADQICNQNGILVSSASVMDLSSYRAESVVDTLAAAGVDLSRFGTVAGKGTDGKGYRTEISVEGPFVPVGRTVGEKIPECECVICHDESKARTCASETETPLELVGRPRHRATRAELKERSLMEPPKVVSVTAPPRETRKAKDCCPCRLEEFESIPDVSNADFHVEDGVIFSKKPIDFKPNSALLFPKSFPVIRTLADLIKAHPKIKVHITGYAGGPATRDDYVKVHGLTNQEGEIEEAASFMELSRWRAEMMQSKLVLCGVDPSQLTVSGAGTDGKGARVELECDGRNTHRRQGDFFAGCVCACHGSKTNKCCRCLETPTPVPLISDEETPLYAIRRGKLYLKKNILFEPMSAMLDQASKADVAELAALFARFPLPTIHINNFANVSSVEDDVPLEKQIYNGNGAVIPTATVTDLTSYRADALVDMLMAAGVGSARFGSINGNGTDGNGARFELSLEGTAPPVRVAGDKIPSCTCQCHP